MNQRWRSGSTVRASFAVHSTAALVFLLAAACSGNDETVGAGGGARTPGGGPGPLFVSIDVAGGFVPMGHDFRTVPQAVIYDDGTTFSPGAIAMIHPGPPVLPVIQGELTEDQSAEIVEAAGHAGLLGGEHLDTGDPSIADAATTTITIVIDGEEHVTSVYALGATSHPGDAPGITPEQQATRQAVQGFVDHVSAQVTEAESGRYEADRYRVLPLEPQPVDAAVQVGEVGWPLEDVELEAGSCTAVAGPQAEVLRAALDTASEITRWRTSSDRVFSIVVRVVLPHEPDCPDTQ